MAITFDKVYLTKATSKGTFAVHENYLNVKIV